MVTGNEIVDQLEQATGRLAEALAWEKTDGNRDSALLRFVLAAELAWKTTKWYLEDRLKVRCTSPKGCFREAYTQGLIEYEDAWTDMISDRNNIAHLYKQEMAKALYKKLPDYLALLQDLLKKLKVELKS